MTERILQIESLTTTAEFIEEFKLFSQDNKAERVIDATNGSVFVLVDIDTHFFFEVSIWTDSDTGQDHNIVLVSKIKYKDGDILQDSKDGFMVFMENTEGDKWGIPIVKIVKDHPFLVDFLNNINPPEKLSRTVYK